MAQETLMGSTGRPAPMRIVQVLEATLGGTGRHVLDLCRGLRGRGHDIHLLYNPDPERMDGLFRKGLPELDSIGVKTVPVTDMHRSVGPSDFKAILGVRRYLRTKGPFHVIHGHSSKAGVYARLGGLGLAGRRLYTPHAFITTNPGLGHGGRAAYGLAERVLGWAGDAVICVSKEEKDHALGLGLSPPSLSIVPNGTDIPEQTVDSGSLRASLGLPMDAVVIGYVGRLVPQKDPENLIRAFSEIIPRNPRAHLAMVGTGPLAEPSRKLAESLGIAGLVHWLGLQDGPSVMCAFDIFALPSRYEGFPYVLIEAMGRGLPIVTTEIGGVGMMIETGANGFVVPPGRHDLLATALGDLAADADLRRKMGANSRERAKRFTLDRMVREIEAVYFDSLSGKESG